MGDRSNGIGRSDGTHVDTDAIAQERVDVDDNAAEDEPLLSPGGEEQGQSRLMG